MLEPVPTTAIQHCCAVSPKPVPPARRTTNCSHVGGDNREETLFIRGADLVNHIRGTDVYKRQTNNTIDRTVWLKWNFG